MNPKREGGGFFAVAAVDLSRAAAALFWYEIIIICGLGKADAHLAFTMLRQIPPPPHLARHAQQQRKAFVLLSSLGNGVRIEMFGLHFDMGPIVQCTSGLGQALTRANDDVLH